MAGGLHVSLLLVTPYRLVFLILAIPLGQASKSHYVIMLMPRRVLQFILKATLYKVLHISKVLNLIVIFDIKNELLV